MKCKHCNNHTRAYQLNNLQDNNLYFPVCIYHHSHKYQTFSLPDYIDGSQGIRYLKRKQLINYIDQC